MRVAGKTMIPLARAILSALGMYFIIKHYTNIGLYLYFYLFVLFVITEEYIKLKLYACIKINVKHAHWPTHQGPDLQNILGKIISLS